MTQSNESVGMYKETLLLNLLFVLHTYSLIFYGEIFSSLENRYQDSLLLSSTKCESRVKPIGQCLRTFALMQMWNVFLKDVFRIHKRKISALWSSHLTSHVKFRQSADVNELADDKNFREALLHDVVSYRLT